MKEETFLKAKDLEARIFRLRLIRDYLKSLLNGDMVQTTIAISFMGKTSLTPGDLEQFHPYAIKNGTTNETDKEGIFNSIERQITKLEEEFYKL